MHRLTALKQSLADPLMSPSVAFMPLLVRSARGHVINTSSMNGFWASLGPNTPHTAYSAAKFAVKGFTEALITDCLVYAPHLKASVVMPGHIGTSIVTNTFKADGRDPKELTVEQLEDVRQRFTKMGMLVDGASDEDLRTGLQMLADDFRTNAPLTAAEAASIILAGVPAGEWRILVGDDARLFDLAVREDPTSAYESSFVETVATRGAKISIVR